MKVGDVDDLKYQFFHENCACSANHYDKRICQDKGILLEKHVALLESGFGPEELVYSSIASIFLSNGCVDRQ
jgi:hypothetical protein